VDGNQTSDGEVKMSSPLIDVILPVYNAESTLRVAVESILKQSFEDFRIFLIDDGSDDDSPVICEQLCRQDPRITYITNIQNRGLVTRLNEGLKLCTAPYVARMDADDISFPDRFQLQLDYLIAKPHAVACSGSYQCINAKGDMFDIHIANNRKPNLRAIPAKPHFLLHPLLMMRRDEVVSIGGYRNILHCEDADLYYRLAAHGELHNLTEILGQYRVHNASVSIISESNRIIQCLNSQLLALFALQKTQDPTRDFLPEHISEQIVKTTPSKKPSLGDALEEVQQVLELRSKDYNWLTIAVFSKYLQESKYRGLTITAADFDLVTTITTQVFTYHPRQYISFLNNFNKWYTSCISRGLKNNYHLDPLSRFILAIEQMRNTIWRSFLYMADAFLRKTGCRKQFK
jgi:glycosyltransferase involved in cell wall biosynthesis